MLRKIRYIIEGIGLLAGAGFFRLLPLDVASSLGGRIARWMGPWTRAHQTARLNMEKALPELSQAARRRALSEMWDNLGRVVGEYPHLNRPLMRSRITVEGLEYLERVKHSQTGAIFISGHFANWEIVPLTAAIYGLKLVLIYREPNNPVASWLLRRMRASFSHGYYRKGREGAQESIRALKAGESVAMLVDQKLSDGRPVSFFGHSAMTATAPVQMAIKFQAPLFMAHIVRTDGAHFHLTLQPPLHFDPKASPEEAMELLHRQFERWIREHPGQWFWVHNRWNWKTKD